MSTALIVQRPPAAATMPRFVQTVQHWQRASGVAAADTTLLGFSQGAIMAIAGRYAQPPRLAPVATRIHLMQGEADPVMPVRLGVEAQAQLQALGVKATLDRLVERMKA